MKDGLKKIAIVAFSYALREKEPNPCNVRIARIVERIFAELTSEGYTVYTVVQWEIALQLLEDGFPVNHIVHPQKDAYLDSDMVWEEAVAMVLNPECINRVVPVAHRWLQIVKVKQLMKGDGFRITKKRIGKIGFDNSEENLQPWTKGPMRALVYAIKQQFLGYRGPAPKSNLP